jgi:hypothetical protein
MFAERCLRPVVATLAVIATVLFAPASARADVTYMITFDTSAVPNGTTGYLDFQFNPGGSNADSATATVTSFVSTAVTFNSATPSGNATGALPGTLTLVNSTSFNEVLENVTFGASSHFSFLLTLSGPAINSPSSTATDGTAFGVGVLDSSFAPLYGTNDPVLRIDIVATNPNPVVTTAINPPVTSVVLQGPGGGGAPEPSALVLSLVGLATLGSTRLLRRARQAA